MHLRARVLILVTSQVAKNKIAQNVSGGGSSSGGVKIFLDAPIDLLTACLLPGWLVRAHQQQQKLLLGNTRTECCHYSTANCWPVFVVSGCRNRARNRSQSVLAPAPQVPLSSRSYSECVSEPRVSAEFLGRAEEERWWIVSYIGMA